MLGVTSCVWCVGTRAGFGIFEAFAEGFGMLAWDACEFMVETRVGGAVNVVTVELVVVN